MTSSGLPSVVVVGGGITGLVAAHSLKGRARVTLLEGSDRLGGKIRTSKLDGVTIEEGPDSFLPRDDEPVELCRSLGLADELVEPSDFGAWLWLRGELRRLPEGSVFGLPSSPMSIVRARILSLGGLARAATEVLRPGRLAGPDVAIGPFIEGRFGREVVARLVDPLLAGTRAGDVDRISMAAAAPAIDELARAHRSLTLALRSARRRGIAGARPRFLGLRGGMQRLTDALAKQLGDAEIRTGVAVTDIRRRGRGYEVSTKEGDVVADGVVVAVAPPVAGAMIRPLSPTAADELEAIRFASVAVATMVYPARTVEIPGRGSGFLVPSSEGKTLAACTWFSKKWPHLAPEDGRIVLRCFAGRSAEDPALDLDDGELTRRLRTDVEDALRIDATPMAVGLTRWDDAIPQLEVGHLDRIAAIESELAGQGGLALAGAGYRGTGIPDCISHARGAARRVVEETS